MKSILYLLPFRYAYLLGIVMILVITPVTTIKAKESVNVLSDNQQHKTQNTGNQFKNPHWQKDACLSCHKEKPKKTNLKKSNLKLHTTDINKLCNSCHTTISKHDYIHPFGMVPSKKIKKNMPGTFIKAVKRGRGKLTCITCHDLSLTCLPEEKSKKGLNPLFFRNGMSGDQFEKGKPAPDIYLTAAAQLGVAPENCLCFEDSGNGILAGKAAGMKVVAVPDRRFSPAAEVLANADIVLKSLQDFSLGTIAHL